MQPLVGFAISFPFSEHSTQTEYVVNEIWQQQALEGLDGDDEDNRLMRSPSRTGSSSKLTGMPAASQSAASTPIRPMTSSSPSDTRTAAACSHCGCHRAMQTRHCADCGPCREPAGWRCSSLGRGDDGSELRVVLTDNSLREVFNPLAADIAAAARQAPGPARGGACRRQPIRALAADAGKLGRHRADTRGAPRPVRRADYSARAPAARPARSAGSGRLDRADCGEPGLSAAPSSNRGQDHFRLRNLRPWSSVTSASSTLPARHG